MRLIDAEPIKKFIVDGLNNKEPNKAFGHDAIEILVEIEYAPTIEATPVVHGRWIDMGDFQSCSICKATRLKKIETPYGKATWVKTKFCSDCGAKMDGGVSDG